MNTFVKLFGLGCVGLACAAAAAEEPRVTPQCIEFATSDGWALSPRCPPKALAALVQDDPLNLRPSLDSSTTRDDPLLDADASRKQPLRLYERRVPGTEIYLAPSPLRNQFVYNPGGELKLGPREQANEFVFGLRVPF